MSLRSLFVIVLNVLAIVVCGAIGAGAGYAARALLGVHGVGGALVATFVAMVVATIAWAIGYSALRAVGWVR